MRKIKMKILIVSHEYPPIGGGGANACMNLAKEYSKEGNQVTIVTVWFEGEKELEHKENITIYRIKAKRKHLEHCGFPEMLDYLVKAIPFTARLQKENAFDICQVFFGIPSGPIGLYLKRKYSLPYVIRFGGGDIPGFQDRFSFIYKLLAPFIISLWKNADALVANSQGLKKLAENFYDKKEILIIPNGANAVDLSQQSYLNAGKDENIKSERKIIRLLFVSRLIERKGLQDILPQLKTISDKLLNEEKSITLDIVGDGPYRETLEQIVKEQGISDLVTFHGQKNKQQLPQYYSQGDIFLFPSRKEGMPNAVLEAMSYGIPIIMTPCQGSDELIDGNGYVSQTSDFEKSILQLCTNDKLREDMGKKSLELVKNKFSWGNTAKMYLEMFDKML